MVADAGCVDVPEVEVVCRQICRRVKRLASHNPHVTAVDVPERCQDGDDRRDIGHVLHHNIHVDDGFGRQPGYGCAAYVCDGGGGECPKALLYRVGELRKQHRPDRVVVTDDDGHGRACFDDVILLISDCVATLVWCNCTPCRS